MSLLFAFVHNAPTSWKDFFFFWTLMYNVTAIHLCDFKTYFIREVFPDLPFTLAWSRCLAYVLPTDPLLEMYPPPQGNPLESFCQWDNPHETSPGEVSFRVSVWDSCEIYLCDSNCFFFPKKSIAYCDYQNYWTDLTLNNFWYFKKIQICSQRTKTSSHWAYSKDCCQM